MRGWAIGRCVCRHPWLLYVILSLVSFLVITIKIACLIVHRLTNDRDREVVERARGEIDHSAASFLPSLKPGEAAIVGADFPIPLTIQVTPSQTKPKSDGPDYQTNWKLPQRW